MEKLIHLETHKLLEKFGAGSHKPGSGSAVALQAMLSAQLIRTVIDLTTDEKRKKNYDEWLQQLNLIKEEVENRIYPTLTELFQKDSDQFDKTIKLRTLRDEEKDLALKNRLANEAQKELKVATEIPLEIVKLCKELAEYSIFIFDHGFQSARGDSGVALNSALASISGCISIINLNLSEIKDVEWSENIIKETNALYSDYLKLIPESKIRVETLEQAVTLNSSYCLEINSLIKDTGIKSTISDWQIEEKARALQNILWKYRMLIWKRNSPNEYSSILQPKDALKALGYQFGKVETLGQHSLQGGIVEIAGLIDNQNKTVEISKKFPLETQHFTAAHELGHALLHKQQLGILHRDRPIDGSIVPRNVQERQADKFAAYFLMPKKQVEDIFRSLFLMNKFVITEDTVFALNEGKIGVFRTKCKNLRGLSRYIASAEYFHKPFISLSKIFQVSVETMAIRLEELELLEF